MRFSLEKYFFRTIIISLFSVDADSNVISYYKDIATIRKVLSQLIIKERKDIILIIYSYSGVANSEAIRGLKKSVREKEIVKAYDVIHCVYITAILMSTEMSALGLLGENLLDVVIRNIRVTVSSSLLDFR